MEVAQPQLQLQQRGVWEREKERKYEDFDVSALFRSASVPKEMTDFNLDGLEKGELVLRKKANSVQGPLRMVEIDTDKEEEEVEVADDDDDDDDDDDGGDDGVVIDAEYVEAVLKECLKAGLKDPRITGLSDIHQHGYIPDHSWRIGYKDHCDDDSSDERQLVPPPNLAGLYFRKVKDESSKDLQASILNYVAPALEEYKRQEGVDYELVKLQALCLTSPPEPEPEPDPDSHGHHMNFFAKLKGSSDDSSPEYFFASLSTQAVHCCKLIYDPSIRPIQHCEHTKCFECDLWARKEK